MTKITIKEKALLKNMLSKYSIAEFSRKYSIPYRTVQDWKSGARTPSGWIVKLLDRLETCCFLLRFLMIRVLEKGCKL